MRRSLPAILIGLLLTLGVALAADGQGIRPELQSVLDALGPYDEVDIIITLSDQLDLSPFRDRDRGLRRSRINRALQGHASATQRPLIAFLQGRLARNIRSFWVFNGIAATVPAWVIPDLARQPGVASIRLDETLSEPTPQSGSAAPAEWNLGTIRAPELWALGHTGAGIVVASMDTGVDPYHPDIGPKWRGGSNSWFDPNGQHSTPYDASGHGTQVMGVMVGGDAGGTSIGVAPGARWIAVKLFSDSGSSTLSRIHQGFQWLLDPDGNPDVDDAPDVVNNSWHLNNTINQCNGEFAPDIAALKAAGIAVLFAAGNTGPGSATSVSPSNDPQAVAVGAVDQWLTPASWSGRGPSACDGGTYPKIVGPGVSVRSADLTFGGLFPNSYVTVSGTSFSTPHLAGGMALLLNAMESRGQPVTVSQVESAVAESAVDLGAAGPDNESGMGLVDLVAAYNWLLEHASSPAPGALQFSAASYSVAENAGSITITVTRTGGSAGAVTVDYQTGDGTATAGADYQAGFGTLSFADGETSRTFTVTILDDALYEGSETVNLALTNPTGGATLGSPASSVLTITDNDPPPQPGALQFSAASYSVAENAGSITITVTRTGGSDGAVTVDYQTGDGTATAGSDYQSASGTLSFASGQTSRTFTVTILDDALYEGSETVNLALSNPTGGATLGSPASAVLTITDNDPPPVPNTISITKAEYAKRKDTLTVHATSQQGAQAALQVTVTLQSGGSFTRTMTWKSKNSRWEAVVQSVAATYGSAPVSVTVFGPEGSQTKTVTNK